MQKKKTKKRTGQSLSNLSGLWSSWTEVLPKKIFFLRWELEFILEFDPVIFITEGSDSQLKYILYPLNTPGNLTVYEDMFDSHNLMGSATGVQKISC